MVNVTICRDHDLEQPGGNSFDRDWRLHSFCSRHSSFKDPAELGLGRNLVNDAPEIISAGLRRKFAKGLAYWLSYFEHGQCLWFLKDDPTPAGVEFQWDGVRNAGLLLWPHRAADLGITALEARRQDASKFLSRYTDWINGDGYCYYVYDGTELIESGKAYNSEYQLMLRDIAYTVMRAASMQAADDFDALAAGLVIEAESSIQTELLQTIQRLLPVGEA